MRTWTTGAWIVWVVASVLAFLKDPILGACVAIFLLCAAVMLQLASNWDDHPDYEAREQVRSQRRQVKWEKNKGARAKDAARWAEHQKRQAARRVHLTDDGERTDRAS